MTFRSFRTNLRKARDKKLLQEVQITNIDKSTCWIRSQRQNNWKQKRFRNKRSRKIKSLTLREISLENRAVYLKHVAKELNCLKIIIKTPKLSLRKNTPPKLWFGISFRWLVCKLAPICFSRPTRSVMLKSLKQRDRKWKLGETGQNRLHTVWLETWWSDLGLKKRTIWEILRAFSDTQELNYLRWNVLLIWRHRVIPQVNREKSGPNGNKKLSISAKISSC